jgi:hypothetical protein
LCDFDIDLRFVKVGVLFELKVLRAPVPIF